MSGIVVLVLRGLLVVALYSFLILIFVTLWREVRQQATLLAMRKTPPLTLSITNGVQPALVRHFTQPEITIGRQPDCECRLEDDSVSTTHARLVYHHGQWWLEDLGSTNGTLLNREKLSLATIVVSGDEIRCGETQIFVSSTGNAPPEDLPA
jgi:pSer/pThr/pTyr-binding forkhead associated (FHA) protein